MTEINQEIIAKNINALKKLKEVSKPIALLKEAQQDVIESLGDVTNYIYDKVVGGINEQFANRAIIYVEQIQTIIIEELGDNKLKEEFKNIQYLYALDLKLKETTELLIFRIKHLIDTM